MKIRKIFGLLLLIFFFGCETGNNTPNEDQNIWCIPAEYTDLENIDFSIEEMRADSKFDELVKLVDSTDRYIDDLVYLPNSVKSNVYRRIYFSGEYQCFDGRDLESNGLI